MRARNLGFLFSSEVWSSITQLQQENPRFLPFNRIVSIDYIHFRPLLRH